jgi:hypothetical protein
MHAEQLRRWVEARRFVEDFQRRSANAPEPRVAWAQALSLFALLGRMTGWPVEPDDIRRREDELARQAWTRLHAAGMERRP